MSQSQEEMLERIANGRTDLVFDYLEQGYPQSATDKEGASLLQRCAYHGDVSAIRFLIKHGETLASLGKNLGLTSAAFHGHWRLCEFLLEHGANASQADSETEETPLHAALCKANRPAYDLVVKVLLAHGANPNCATKPMMETGGFMRDCRTKGETPLHRAAAFGTETAIRLLLAAGAKVDTKDFNGDSPLSWASWHRRPDSILRMLCYDGFSIHPQRQSSFDHGTGWGTMEMAILGTPDLAVPKSKDQG
jgi:ankyrin repeat protein